MVHTQLAQHLRDIFGVEFTPQPSLEVLQEFHSNNAFYAQGEQVNRLVCLL